MHSPEVAAPRHRPGQTRPLVQPRDRQRDVHPGSRGPLQRCGHWLDVLGHEPLSQVSTCALAMRAPTQRVDQRAVMGSDGETDDSV
ncbi:MAG: hypothetical protein ACRDTJ_22795, partial [Pseudonocardiaceae bacterium]